MVSLGPLPLLSIHPHPVYVSIFPGRMTFDLSLSSTFLVLAVLLLHPSRRHAGLGSSHWLMHALIPQPMVIRVT